VVVFAVLAVGALAIWPSGSSASGGSGSGGGLVGGSGGSGTWGPLVVFGILLVTVLIVPRLLGPLVRIGGLPFRIFRNEERLARSALIRDKSRTTLTAGALVVGVAMIVALGTAAQDVRKIGANWLTETIPGSELLTSIRPVLTTDPVRAELAAKPGVKSVSPIGVFAVGYLMTTQVDGRPSTSIVRQEAAAISGPDYLADGRLTFVQGDRTTALTALASGGAVIVPESVAGPAGINLNDTLEFATGSIVTKLRCVGIVQRSIPAQSQEAMLMGWADAPTFGVTGADFFAVRYQPDMEAAARAAVDADALSYALEPNQLDRVSGTVGDALDRIFRLLDGLALIAVLVAGLGMVNTFSMSVLERVREIGVLRATGMTSGQVWGMVVIEAGILGIVGSTIGAVVGLVVGILLVGWSSGGFAFAFDPPWFSIALAYCFGILISIIAAIYPAGLASRFSIVRALQHE
jgi:putative ABC transport system permease protein